ncbi:hypothetical protein KP509_17G062500 [Ceratopteris richardii]|nr:hypothetical protein KP509_17G062500 [Ceratopteris richardii]
MLVTVSWMGSLIWEVRVVMNVHETVSGLIKAALAAFAKEGRYLPSDDCALYPSRFSLHSLDETAKLKDLGARNFILRLKDSK